MKNVISIRDFSKEDILNLIKSALQLKERKDFDPNLLSGKKVASLFFENSTRTRISSETAVTNLGGEINGFAGSEGTSVKKGEPIIDTARMLEGYGYDALIVRHNLAGAVRYISDMISIPVINAGDGNNGHPTQTLLDLLTIFESFERIDGLKIALVGDLKYGRTVHSMLQALEKFNVEVWLVSPPNLKMPKWRVMDFNQNAKHEAEVVSDLREILPQVDVLYMTRIQRERFPTGPEGEIEFNKVSGIYSLTASMLEGCKKDMIILHPLPRDKRNIEIAVDVDATPHARYLEQAKNGLYMREAITKQIFSKGFQGVAKTDDVREAALEELPINDGTKKGEKLIYRLAEGTLIDHIEEEKGLAVCRLLGLDQDAKTEVVVSMNIRSKKYGRKDVLAVHNATLSMEQMYKVALVSLRHTINVIENERAVKKGRVILPTVLDNLLVCKNPLCVSRDEHQEFAPSKFYVESQAPLRVRCHYCEKLQREKDIEIKF